MNLHTNVDLPKGTLSASLMIDVNAVSCRIYRTVTYPSIIIFCQKLDSNFNGCLNEIFIPLTQNSINSFRRLLCCFSVPYLQEADRVSIAPFDKFVLFCLNQTIAPQLCPFSATLGEPALVIGVSTKMFS